jgi:hypothetical protein
MSARVEDVISLTMSGVGSDMAITPNVPAGYGIRAIYVQETANHSITGGLDIGTTSTGNDVVSAFAVSGHAFASVGISNILKTVFSASAAQTIYLHAHSAWNSAVINVTVVLDRAIV